MVRIEELIQSRLDSNKLPVQLHPLGWPNVCHVGVIAGENKHAPTQEVLIAIQDDPPDTAILDDRARC